MNTFHRAARSAAIGLLAIPFVAFAAPAADTAADRKAILAMQGEYAVEFAFDETVRLQPGYLRKPPQRSGGDETVIVVEDTPGRIVLQHILVHAKSGHVTKHWRQDWVYEATSRFAFTADQTWTVHALAADATRGRWTQCVYEVSDAPRYCGTGTWEHANGISTWTSDTTWRPLPRREYTKRNDYNAMEVVNRHTITPGGWTHEQFNTKVQRMADGARTAIAREFGFNDYGKTTGIDFKPAYTYWDATKGYWAKVRDRWQRRLGVAPGLRLKTGGDGMAMIMPLFAQAEAVQAGKTVGEGDIEAVFSNWVEVAVSSRSDQGYGVLVMAHGGGETWNREVGEALAPLRAQQPLEIAFGMADAASLQEGVRRLESQGVQRIGVVRLFISGESWFERTRQILGLSPGAPVRPDSATRDAHAGDGAHGGHSMEFWRLDSSARFAISQDGLADAPQMGEVLADRARALSREPAREDVLILAHGPGDDGENERWLHKIDERADAVRKALPFRRVQVLTLREDWPDKREVAEALIRDFVGRSKREGGRAIVIPFRVQGFGPYAEVLDGLDYAADGKGLLPSPQVADWVRQEAEILHEGGFVRGGD